MVVKKSKKKKTFYLMLFYVFVDVKSGPGKQSSKQRYYPNTIVPAQAKPIVQSPSQLQPIPQSSKQRQQKPSFENPKSAGTRRKERQ